MYRYGLSAFKIIFLCNKILIDIVHSFNQLVFNVEISAATDLASQHTIRWEGMGCSASNYRAAETLIQEQLENMDCMIQGRCQWQFQINNCNNIGDSTGTSSQISANLLLRIHESLVSSPISSMFH